MPEESLVTPEIQALVGKHGEAGTARVTRRALDRAWDVYFGEFFPGELQPGDPVPGVVVAGIENEAERLEVPSLLPNSLLVSNEWEFDRQLRFEEELTARSRIAGITERMGGRFGYSIYIRTEVEFTGADGRPAARVVTTMMQYDAKNAGSGGEDDDER